MPAYHAEAFGPAALVRTLPATARPPAPVSTHPVPAFTRSGKEAGWTPASGSLLELAEARGLSPPFSCRSGTCGTCVTRVLAGRVAYPANPVAAVAEDKALICRAVPADPEAVGSDRLVLHL